MRKTDTLKFTGPLILFLLIALSAMLGRYDISFIEAVKIIVGRILPIPRTWTAIQEQVVCNIRLPRIFAALLAGAALSVAGGAYQGVFQNPMASPDILGASSGAAFGAAVAILLRMPEAGIVLCSFSSALITVTLVYALAAKLDRSRTLALILCGIMISSLMTSGTSLIKLAADPTDQLPEITYWLMGSLSGMTWQRLGRMTVPLLIGLIPILLLRWKLDLLSMGDDEAAVLGVKVTRARKALILSSTLATSSVIATCGTIGWVGLVIPHLARSVVGAGNRKLIPASTLFGAAFLLIVDDFARCMFTSEIPLGVLTAFIGAPFFIFLMFKERANGN